MRASTGEYPPVYAPVRILTVYVTETCNLACTYCFQHDKKPRHMSLETMRKTVDFFVDRNVSGALYEVYLTFFGGEPFTQLDCIEEGIRCAREPRPNVYKKIKFTTTTNGTVAGPRLERMVRDSDMSLLVSMDGGHGPNSFRPFHSGRSSHALVARNLQKYLTWSQDVAVRMTFHPQSLDLVGSVKSVLSLGAPSIVLSPVIDAPWHLHLEALEEAYAALADLYVSEARAGRILPLDVTNRFLRESHLARQGYERPPRPCGVGASLISVDTDGRLLPCHQFIYRKEDNLGDVDRAVMRENRWQYVHLSSADIVGCDACLARSVCGGGCRAVVLNGGGGLYDTHPGYCITTRAHVRAVDRIYKTLTEEENESFARLLKTHRIPNAALAELTYQ